MHSAALHLAPILAAEKSKVPFYVAGGVLVAWALIVSLGLGLRRSNFPGSPSGERAVMAVTAVLVLAAVSMAVVTSGPTAKAGAAAGSAQQAPASSGSPAAPAASAPASTSTTQPKATTGIPAPASPAPAAATTALALAANPGGLLSYDAKHLSAKAGSVAITLTNAAPLEHNVTVAQGATVLGATPTFLGGHRTLTLKLKPGTYTFYCSVPGHRQAGMEGTLTVS
jgi:plastocyanin